MLPFLLFFQHFLGGGKRTFALSTAVYDTRELVNSSVVIELRDMRERPPVLGLLLNNQVCVGNLGELREVRNT